MWDSFVIHHSASTDGRTFNWAAIRRYHTSWRYQGSIVTQDVGLQLLGDGKKVIPPWADIGYHYGVELVGNEYEVLMGRPLTMAGGHCHQMGMNKKGIGICFVGNYDDKAPPPEMLEVAAERIIVPEMMSRGIPVDRIFGHRDFAPKTCPGKKFDLALLKRIVSNRLAKAKASVRLSPMSVKYVQAMLKVLGYDPGPVDGLMGRKTGRAIRKLQAQMDLPVDGEIGPRLLWALSTLEQK